MNVLKSSLTHFFTLLFFNFLWSSHTYATAARSDLLHVPELDFFQKLTVRAGFTATTTNDTVVVLLQQQGYVDFVASYWLTVPVSMTVDDVTFVQTSTNIDVLNVTTNTNLIVSSSATDSLNVTIPLSFDSMVGQVNYTISALNNGTSEVIDTVTIQFLIVGMTFYRQRPGDEIEIVSGDENQWILSYQQAMSTAPSWEAIIHVFIQYGDGTNSTITSPKFLRYGDSLTMSLLNVTGEVVHDPDSCIPYDVVELPSTGTLDLCSGCGCGFYYDSNGYLSYGCEFQQYQIGLFSIEFSWPDIIAGNTALAGEVYELPLHVNIFGVPPLAVVGIYPSTMLRPEGGEVRTLHIINVELNNAIQFELRVDTIDKPFAMIPETFQKFSTANYTYKVSFLTQPGNGTDLNWKLFYLSSDSGNNSTSNFEMAACVSTLVHVFTYDERPLRIDSISPEFGSENGGETITLTGYFPYFSPERDAVYMSGYRIEREFILSATDDTILFILPPHSLFGSSCEYHVTVQVGFASSNHVLFSYYVYDASLRISVIGASEVSTGTYKVGDCAVVRFTGVVSPLTSQILSYGWVLQANSSTSGNMLQDTPLFLDIDTSAQSISISSNSIEEGVYSLRLVVTMVKVILEQELILMRDTNVMTIGVHILQPPNRTVTYPDTPLRLAAIISTPSCYEGNQTIVYEWSAFGVVEQYSSLNGTVTWTQAETTPMTTARLGWEFVVPKEHITVGTHDVFLRVWVDGENPPISGEASAEMHIFQSDLVAVIRNGESGVTVNYLTNFHVHGMESYDPDLFGNERNENLIYEWSCRQSSTLNFAPDSSSPCIPGLIPDSTASGFFVPMSVAEALVDVTFIQYSLVVRKGAGRVSPKATITVEIQDKGALPCLDEFNITLSNTAGTLIDWADVYHFQDLILKVTSSNTLSRWKYELIDPVQIDFFASHNLIDEPSFYAPPSTISNSSGDNKPLGIRAFALRPATTYYIKVVFAENVENAETEVTVRIQTNEAIIVSFPPPVITEGEAGSTFILTAGVPRIQSEFSYYFMITDSDGNNLCVGGCTGYDVSTFELNRADNYSITVLLYDSQGTALLSSATSVEQIIVSSSSVSEPYQLKLDKLFLEGNDQAWLMLAQDVMILLLEQQMDFITRDGPREEGRVALEMDYAANIARDGSKLFCNSFPNSMHGNQCISFLYYISALRLLDVETIYNLMQTATCCIKNTPPRTRKLMLPWLTYFIKNLNRLTKQMIQGGNTRTRLSQTSGEPANAFADVQIWTGEVTADVAVSGQVDGFTAEFETGDNQTAGYISVTLGKQMSDLPADLVNGISRSVVRGPSQNELFYPRDDCLAALFSSGKRIIMVFHVTDNFVVYGFQDPPLRSNLVDRLYWTQVYSVDENWNLREVPVRWNDNFCFCWRLPVERLQDELASSVADMPGLYAVERLKSFRQDIQEKGEVFVYNYAGSKTSEYNATEGWVEGCRGDVGLVSTTVVSKSGQNIIAEDNILILGKGAWAIVALVVGALLVMLVAVVATWLVAVKSMADSGMFGGEFDVYVERDVYGRGTAPRT